MQTQPKLQGLEIGQLVKRLADLRGNELKVDTPHDAATSPKEPAVATATINKRTVSYQTTYHPARVLTLLLRNWEQPVIMNGISWQPSTGSTKEQDRLLVYRQKLPLAGQPEMKKSPELHGNPSPAIKALGVEFSVPPMPGYPDWRSRHLSAPDPDAQWQHFGLNVWATVTPRLKLSDEAALECRFLAHEDIPYLIFGELAQAEVEEQTETAVQRAVEKLEEITGARNFQTTMDAQEAAGSHSAYTCGERVRLNTNGKCRAGKMAQTDCEETVNASFARALYLNPDAGLVPVSGHYDTGATVLIVPKAVRLVGQDGEVQEQELPGRPRHNAQALRRYRNPARVRSISLLLEIRPLHYDGEAEQQWVDTDLLVRRYGDHAVATLSDQFTGDAETLTDLLVHMAKQYVNQKYTEPWEQRLKCAVSAHRALGDEDTAFQTELDIMARKFLSEQRSRPHRDHFEIETAEGIISWTRKPKEPEHTLENAWRTPVRRPRVAGVDGTLSP